MLLRSPDCTPKHSGIKTINEAVVVGPCYCFLSWFVPCMHFNKILSGPGMSWRKNTHILYELVCHCLDHSLWSGGIAMPLLSHVLNYNEIQHSNVHAALWGWRIEYVGWWSRGAGSMCVCRPGELPCPATVLVPRSTGCHRNKLSGCCGHDPRPKVNNQQVFMTEVWREESSEHQSAAISWGVVTQRPWLRPMRSEWPKCRLGLFGWWRVATFQ